jgi:hypothetical protein
MIRTWCLLLDKLIRPINVACYEGDSRQVAARPPHQGAIGRNVADASHFLRTQFIFDRLNFQPASASSCPGLIIAYGPGRASGIEPIGGVPWRCRAACAHQFSIRCRQADRSDEELLRQLHEVSEEPLDDRVGPSLGLAARGPPADQPVGELGLQHMAGRRAHGSRTQQKPELSLQVSALPKVVGREPGASALVIYLRGRGRIGSCVR